MVTWIRRKRFFFFVVLMATVVLVSELASAIAIEVANRWLGEDIQSRRSLMSSHDRSIERFLATEGAREVLDSLLGFRYRSGFVGEGDTVNSRGLRGSREYTLRRRDDLGRIAAFGDSFVYCSEVGPTDCWTSQMESGWAVEVLNFGVGGYGTDQALLRFLRARGAGPPAEIVIIGFAPVNVRRNVNRYRKFISPGDGPYFKPRYLLQPDGSIDLLPTPVRDTADLRALVGNLAAIQGIGEQDYWYEPLIYDNPLIDWSATVRLVSWTWAKFYKRYADPDRMLRGGALSPSSSLFSLQLKLLEAFSDSVAADGSIPHIVIFPDRDSTARSRLGKPTVYAPLYDSLVSHGMSVIDLVDAFDADPSAVPSLFMPGGHYSPIGNRVVAQRLAVLFELPPLSG